MTESHIKGKIVLVTGMSGAGKSIAMHSLEDLGFEAIDNIPLSILPMLTSSKERVCKLALGIDIRNRDFSIQGLIDAITYLRSQDGFEVTLLFLDCDDEVLRRRFSYTRRKHPISKDHLITDGIKHERQTLQALRDYADLIIDSSNLSTPELRKYLTAHFSPDYQQQMYIVVGSFSFRNGLPREADLVFDVRFLKNPFYIEELKELSGNDHKIGRYIEQDPSFGPFFDNLVYLITPLLPIYQQEGKRYLGIAIGCTGGKHRSVFVAEQLSAKLRQTGFKVDVRHRDLKDN